MCWAFVTQSWTEGLGCALLPLGLKSGSDAVCFDFTLVVKDSSAKNIEGDRSSGAQNQDFQVDSLLSKEIDEFLILYFHRYRLLTL